MVAKKVMDYEEVRSMLLEHVSAMDRETVCGMVGDIFGVKCVVSGSDVEIEPYDSYGGVFGEFETVVDVRGGICECGSLFDPEKDVFSGEGECKCGEPDEHWHCFKCGSIKQDAF